MENLNCFLITFQDHLRSQLGGDFPKLTLTERCSDKSENAQNLNDSDLVIVYGTYEELKNLHLLDLIKQAKEKHKRILYLKYPLDGEGFINKIEPTLFNVEFNKYYAESLNERQ